MLARLSIAVLLSLPCAACAESAPDELPDLSAPPGEATAPAAPLQGYNLDTPIQLLASNPVTSAILDENLPGLLEDSNYPFFKGMSLKMVASLSRGQITAPMLETIAEKLKSVPVTTASN